MRQTKVEDGSINYPYIITPGKYVILSKGQNAMIPDLGHCIGVLIKDKKKQVTALCHFAIFNTRIYQVEEENIKSFLEAFEKAKGDLLNKDTTFQFFGGYANNKRLLKEHFKTILSEKGINNFDKKCKSFEDSYDLDHMEIPEKLITRIEKQNKGYENQIQDYHKNIEAIKNKENKFYRRITIYISMIQQIHLW